MADKKFIVLGVLATAVLGLGAFQFIGGGPTNEPRPDPKPKPAPSRADKETEEFPQPAGVGAGPARDPFAKPAGTEPAASDRGPGRLPDGTRFKPPDAEQPTTAIQGPKLPPLGGTPSPSVPVERALNGCGWEAVGVVVGPVPIAVLRNSAGEVVLVREGHKTDDQTRILKVTSRSVTVRHLKKTVTLAIGGGVVEHKE